MRLTGTSKYVGTCDSHIRLAKVSFQLSYTDQFLGILAMTLAKCSILLLFRRLMSQSNLLVAFATLSSSIGVYFLFSIFATAFQCGLPHPWSLEPATCPTHGRILYAVIGMNMVTDGLLAVWIIPSIWNLQMERGPLHVVMSLFAARFVYDFLDPNCVNLLTLNRCVAVEAAQIVLTERSLRSADQTCKSPFTF